jgi:hypothetical protein
MRDLPEARGERHSCRYLRLGLLGVSGGVQRIHNFVARCQRLCLARVLIDIEIALDDRLA